MSETLRILLEDNHCIAVNKPSGLPTQSASESIPSLEAAVKAYLRDSRGKSGRVYLGIPHRLDRPASGVVLFARQTKSAQRLAEQFQKRQVHKIYWAVVEGRVETEQGTWEDWVRKIPGAGRAELSAPGDSGAKLARLSYQRKSYLGDLTFLEIELETGRMHQIRLQAASRGWPILGDVRYGAQHPFGEPDQPDRGIALHARSLTFLHPIRYEPVTVTAEVPRIWTGSALSGFDFDGFGF
jgi:23S rRNA pseudouridine1911/1915/1917 synthase